MSFNRRHLVQRNRNQEQSSPAQRSRPRQSQTPAQLPATLPPYQPPSCPLSDDAKRNIENLRIEQNLDKYKKHIKSAIKTLGSSTAECNERLAARKAILDKIVAKNRDRDGEDEEPSVQTVEAEKIYSGLKDQVEQLTADAEKALRDLIDYGDELTMRDTIMKDVHENIMGSAALPTRRPRRRRDDYEESRSEDEAETPAEDPEILSAVELLAKAKEDYATKYRAKSMKSRYAENNDYVQFKKLIHDSQHSRNDNAPPVPHSRTWFPEENDVNRHSRRSRHNTTDHTANGDDDDDEINIVGEKQVLKCPLTLRHFEEPYSNKLCPHTFEKSAIIDYVTNQGVSFTHRGHTVPSGPKRAKCPQSGCDQMLSLGDFYDDELIARQVKRELKKNNQIDEDDADDDRAPRGTQANNPEQLDDQDSDDLATNTQKRTREAARIKRERHQSRGLSVAPSSQATANLTMDIMDVDDDDNDEA